MAPRRRVLALFTGLLLVGGGLPATVAGADPAPPEVRLDELSPEERERLPLADATAGAGTADRAGTPSAEAVSLLDNPPPAAPGTGSDGDGAPTAEPAADAALEASGGQVAVIVRLRDQVDLEALEARGRTVGLERGEAARGRAVVDELKAESARSQADVQRVLDAAERAGRARDIRSFWIFNGFAATIDATTLEELAGHPDVASVELDEEIVLPDPPGEPRLPVWSLEAVNAPTAWGDYGYTGAGVVVGIMDSGADGGHPALSGRYRGRDGDHAHSWFAATGENYAIPGDGHGHGTHVTGSIVGGAPGDIIGVAPDAEWIMAKIFRDSGSTTTSIIHAGFEWMLAPGGDPAAAPDVVSNSWGSAATYNTEFLPDVQAWVAAGIVPVFAAGNDGPGPQTIGSPGSFPESVAVGATDINDLVAGFSSRGPVIWDGVEMVKPDLAAPGAAIYSTWPRNLDPDGYNTISGTSMATPHVTGVVALLLDAEPNLSVDAVRELLTSTARDEPHMGRVPNNDYGAGIADAEAAIVSATLSGSLTGTITGPDGPVAATVEIPALGIETTAESTTGFYELVVRQGTWEVDVSAYGYLDQTFTIEIAIDEELVRDVALVAAPVYAVSGVVTAGGAPVAGAVVRAQGAPIGPDYTDARGAYSLEIAAGSYVFNADATGYRRASRMATVDSDLGLDFALEPVAQSSDAGWSQYQNNPARTGFSAEALAGAAVEQAWTARPGGQAFFSSPVIADGRVFLATDNGAVHAVSLDDGSSLWSFATGSGNRATPAVADGLVYVGGGVDGRLYALDAATGSPAWSYATGDYLTYAAPTVVDGVVYFGTGFTAGNGGWIYALDADTGALRWRTFVGAQIFFAPAVGGSLVFGASYDAQRLVALDAATGAEAWSLTRETDTFLSMPSYADGVLYVTTTGLDGASGSLLALDAGTGDLAWENMEHGDGAGNTPVVFGDLVIAGSDVRNWVRGYDRASGEVAWTAPIGSAVSNSQLAADGVIAGGSQQDHRAWALDAYTGELIWEQTLNDNVLSAPALADGRLVVAVRRGDLYAFTAPGTIAGSVTDTADAPLAAKVSILETGTSTETDPATGAYVLEDLAGEVTVEARSYGYVSETAAATIRSGQVTELDFALEVGGDGSLTGTARDEAGAPLAGVELVLADTPLAAVLSGADGSFGWAAVAEGSYALTATRDGYAPVTTEVTITAGEGTVVELTLPKYEIAVTGDYNGAITRLLTADGYLVDATTAAEIADRPGDYRLIVANGAQDDPGEAAFEALVANAATAETSILFLDTWGISYGSIEHLKKYLADPATTGSNYNDGEVSLVARADHPLTASLGAGGRVEILAPETEYAWFANYSGRSLADVYIGDAGRAVGSGIGYEATSIGSVHVLLSLHAASPWSGPTGSWQPAARAVFDDAVGYALDPAFGSVSGTVTDGSGAGVPATVTVVETGETTTADTTGAYDLLLAPGAVTLRFERIGYETVDRTVTVLARESAVVDVALTSSGLGGIAGTITDATDGAPLAGATVSVAGTELAGTTATDGTYVIDGVPGGTYSVEIPADGYLTRSIEGVEVVNGAVTTLDASLDRRLRVAVIGDDGTRISDLLTANEMIATPTGWEAIDRLDQYDLLILHDPLDPGEAVFTAHLAAIDEAGISAIWIEGALSADGGVRLLRKYLGEPETRDFVSSDGNPLFHPVDPGHPLFDGLTAPIQVLAGDEWGAYFNGYSGFKLADFGTDELGVLGIGAAYEPTGPGSVRLLLSALSSSSLARPGAGWTADGERLFVNGVRWAAAPHLAVVSGRVADESGAPLEATVRVVETGVDTVADEAGTFALGHPAGEYTIEVSAFGYVTQTFPRTLVADETIELDVTLALGPVGEIGGVVTSSGDISPQAAVGDPLAGATVQLVGFPRSAITDEDGAYTLPNVEPGKYQLEVAADGHVRRIVDDVVVTAGARTAADVALRASPTVGVIDDDADDLVKGYLAEWGYIGIDLAWTDTDRLGDINLVLANLANGSPRDDPGAAGFAAFQDAANRAHVPVVWLDQFGRGSIRYLTTYNGDPTTRGEDRSDGTVSARILADHPLTAGFEVGSDVPLVEPDQEYSFFNGYSGTTVASVVSGDLGVRGGLVGYRGRTASSADVLLSTLTFYDLYGHPAVGDVPAVNWLPAAECFFHNGLSYALDAPPLAAEVAGAVTSSAGGALVADVRVVETGDVVHSRSGDGTYLLPLQPGTWTVEFSTFGHASETREVTVAAGDAMRIDVTLTADAAGALTGTVTETGGAPIAGATVTLEGTPLSATTDAAGAYTIPSVPAGEYSALVRAAGHEQVRRSVTITAGATTRLDVELRQSRVVAVAGDYVLSGTPRLGSFLAENGYAVRQWSWADVQNHVGELDEVAMVILNGNGTDPTAAELTTFVQAADAAAVPLIVGGQFSGGAFEDLRDTFGDPPTVDWDFTTGAIHYRPGVAHPIFAGYPVGEPIELVRDAAGGNQQYLWFSGYSGTELATMEAADPGGDGLLGDGVAYRFATPSSVHLLLASLGAATYGYPGPGGEWTDDAERIYLNAVAWALDAAQGEIFGIVTSSGEPVAGATVMAVEAGASTTTASDGTYRLGVPDGTHTVRITRDGYEPFEATVTVAASEPVQLDVELTRLARGSISGSVVDEAGAPVEGASVSLDGPMSDAATTDAAGGFGFDDLVPGAYTLSVTADGYQPAEASVEVVANETAEVMIELNANSVGVLGDADGAFVEFLGDNELAAEELTWTDADRVARYEVLIVNGGEPSEAEFDAMLDAADAAEASVIFTGSWGVETGGIRILESFRPDEVSIAAHGYRSGPVEITGFDPDHPLFDSLTDPFAPVAEDGYWSAIDSYVGSYLADLEVDGAGAGVAVAYDWRSAGSLHLLLSSSAVTGLIGPGYGWTDDGARLVLNAVAWARDAEQVVPSAPTLATDAETPTTDDSVVLTGSAEFRSVVTILRNGEPVATADPARDGSFTVEVGLLEGVNTFTAHATNFAGDSAPSDEVEVIRDLTGPVLDWTPADGDGFFTSSIAVTGTAIDEFAPPVTVTVNGTAVAVAGDGSWSRMVALALGANAIEVEATDALGNVTSEARSVGYVPYTATWQVAGGNGRGTFAVFLDIADAAGDPRQVTSVTLQVRDVSGAVVVTQPMSWDPLEQRYRTTVRALPRGRYQLIGRLVVDGWNVTLVGPEVMRR